MEEGVLFGQRGPFRAVRLCLGVVCLATISGVADGFTTASWLVRLQLGTQRTIGSSLLVGTRGRNRPAADDHDAFGVPPIGQIRVTTKRRAKCCLQSQTTKVSDPIESWSLSGKVRNTTTLIFPETKLQKWLTTWCDTSYYDGRPKTLLRGLSHELAFFSLPIWTWYPPFLHVLTRLNLPTIKSWIQTETTALS